MPPVPPEAVLESISNEGELLITFSQDMRSMLDFAQQIRNKKMKNGKSAFEFRVLYGALSDAKKIDYQWRVSEYSKRSLKVQIDFSNPIYVSMEEDPEMAEVVINDGSIFISEDGLPLKLKVKKDQAKSRELREEEEPLILMKKFPPQKPSSDADKFATAALESAATGSQAALMGNFFLNLALSASLNQLWGMINTQQLLVLMPLLQVILPGNAQTFF